MQSIYKYSFILRLWRVEHSEPEAWLSSLEIPETGKRIGFANMEQLFAYLIDFIENNAAGQESNGKCNEECNK